MTTRSQTCLCVEGYGTTKQLVPGDSYIKSLKMLKRELSTDSVCSCSFLLASIPFSKSLTVSSKDLTVSCRHRLFFLKGCFSQARKLIFRPDQAGRGSTNMSLFSDLCRSKQPFLWFYATGHLQQVFIRDKRAVGSFLQLCQAKRSDCAFEASTCARSSSISHEACRLSVSASAAASAEAILC